MVQILNKSKCCGCTACANACPKKCITMSADEEGFLYPVINMKKCISCGKCEQVCPCIQPINFNQDWKTRAFVLKTKDEFALKESTSGGAFSSIAEYICDKGGTVVGASFDEKYHIVHKAISDYSNISELRGSKYAQSELGEMFSYILGLLKQGKLVCFSGTPCQVAGLKNYLGKDYNNLYTIDVVCRSIPSPKLWDEYIRQFDKWGGVKQVKFRNKTYGYHSGTFVIEFKNGKRISGSNRVNKYMKAFHMNICSRPSCYDCNFKTIKRVSDFTLFDCWYPEKLVSDYKDDDKGCSGCLVHSDKGLKLIKNIITKIFIYEVNVEKALNYTGGMAEHSITRPITRNEFYTTLAEKGVVITLDKYVEVSLLDKVIECVKGVLYKTHILEKIKKSKQH